MRLRRRVAATVAAGCTTVGLALLAPQPAGAATQTVTTCTDAGTGSLRQAVLNAGSGDTVAFALSPACTFIPLASAIAITTDLTIAGPGASALIVSASSHKTLFTVGPGVTATISGLTIENGATGIVNAGTLTVSACTLTNNGSATGGAIINDGALTVTGSTLSGNGVDVPAEGGGAIDNQGGTLHIGGSTLTGNTAAGGANGGAIDNNAGTVTITGSTLTGNSAGHGNGGALYNNGGTSTITTTTLSGNSAVDGTGGAIDNTAGAVTVGGDTLARNGAFYGPGGGAIDNGATVTIANSTFFANSASFGGEGGAILNAGTLSLAGSTLAHNSAADDGGALFGPATVTTSILALNTAGGDCSQPVTDDGDNLADDATCGLTAPTDISATPAGLAPGRLADNGGPTKTVALEASSPAVGAVKNKASCATPDQRGVARPVPCDIGAVQLALPPQVITSASHATATAGTPFSFTVTTTGVPLPTISIKGPLPPHLKLTRNDNGTAVISGTPRKDGVFLFSVRSTFGRGATKTVVLQPFILTVVA
jgi:hypothetical protein